MTERMLGDGFAQGSPVSSNQSERSQPERGTTVRDTGSRCSAATSRANSPTVSPVRTGIGCGAVNDRRSGSISGPSTIRPVMGFGRSSTKIGMPCRPASSIA